MKIKILTVCKASSYGAFLQCYALSEFLIRRGHQVKLIFIPEDHVPRSCIYRMADKFKEFVFARARHRYYHVEILSDPKTFYENGDELFIVGSDQIWNPDITKSSALNYFFDFLPDSVRRISYAASFGTPEWMHPELAEPVKKLLQKFTSVSVREDSGVEICKKQFGLKNVAKTIDPTLLLADFSVCLNRKQNSNAGKIVVFTLHRNVEYYGIINTAAARLGVDAVQIGSLFFQRNHKLSLNLSVQNWVNSIANAGFVITDSFHATVFSLLFKRNFLVLPPPKGRAIRNG